MDHIQNDLGDGKRTKRRYEDAARKLKQSLGFCKGNWQPFDIPEFNDVPNDALPQVQEAIENMLKARDNAMQNPEFWSKKKRAVKRVFTAISPFAKNFLQVAKEGSSVYVHFIFYYSFTVDTRFEPLWVIGWWTIALNYGLLLEYLKPDN